MPRFEQRCEAGRARYGQQTVIGFLTSTVPAGVDWLVTVQAVVSGVAVYLKYAWAWLSPPKSLHPTPTSRETPVPEHCALLKLVNLPLLHFVAAALQAQAPQERLSVTSPVA